MAGKRMGPWRMPVGPQGDEGRGKLRKAGGRSTHPVIPGFPNGVTRTPRGVHLAHEEDSAEERHRVK